MALMKSIIMPNGITLDYHRIAMIKIDTNQQITLLIESYLDESNRNIEKTYTQGNNDTDYVAPYTNSTYVSIPYDENLDILNKDVLVSAYEWLKKQDSFIESKNV